MLGSWFRSVKKPVPVEPEAPRAASVDPAHPATPADAGLAHDAEASAAPELEATAHDIALATVDARLQQLDEATQRRNRRGTLETTSDGTSQFHSLPPDSAAETPRRTSASIEHAYDPYSGAVHGIVSPMALGAEHTQDLLWGHLANIRELQSEIAQMHVEMEKMGDTNDTGRETTRDLEDDLNMFTGGASHLSEAEAQKREAERQEKEFNDLAMRFRERKLGIENIMNKLNKLSDAVTAFHALPAPNIRFHSSRNTAGDASSHARESPMRATVGTSGLFHPEGHAHAPIHDSPSSTQASFSAIQH